MYLARNDMIIKWHCMTLLKIPPVVFENIISVDFRVL